MMTIRMIKLISLIVTAVIQFTSGQQVYLSLGSTNIIINNTEILITDIGEDDYYNIYNYDYLGGLPSLTCHTDLTYCCRAGDHPGSGGLGAWYYPDRGVIQNNAGSMAVGEVFYIRRNDAQLIRLNRRVGNNPLTPTGSYCCVIPTTGGEMTFCANIVVCPSLPPLTNGTISYSDSTLGVGSVATHSCDTGYTLNGGSTTRTCQSSGTWSGSALTCIITCPSLHLTVGTVSYSDSTLGVGNVATYHCFPAGRVTRTCQGEGSWSGTPSACEAFCPPLPTPLNGAVSYDQNTLNLLYGKDTIASYTCNQGYVLMGESNRFCQSDETWTSSAPYCADQVVAQLKFGPTAYCLDWSEDKVSLMQRVLRETIQEAVLTVGNHTLPLEHISEGVFSCYGCKNHTTYRTTITGTDTLSADKAVRHLEKWVEGGKAKQVQWYLVYFDLICPVRISSMSERECGGDEATQRCVDICVARGRR